jgi:hypothetical protein
MEEIVSKPAAGVPQFTQNLAASGTCAPQFVQKAIYLC